MRLVACPNCRAQFDVTDVQTDIVRCHCGTDVDNVAHTPVDAAVLRCGSCGALVDENADTCGYCDSTLARDPGSLSLVCPECYARNDEASRFCTGCGLEFSPQEIAWGDEEPLACPACGTELALRSIGGIRVQECSSCNGLWAPGESFTTLIEKAVEARRQQVGLGHMQPDRAPNRTAFQSKVVYRKCPECGGTMQRKNFGRKSGVIVDWCGKHGTWLDADELEDIAAFVAAGGLAGQAGLTERLPAGEERMRAVFTAEKLMAGEQTRLQRQKDLLEGDSSLLGTLGDFLTSLLG